MANSRFYSSTALETTLTNSITPSTTIIQVAATVGFPGSLPYRLAVDYGSASMELVEVTAVAGLNLTVTRAIDGTSASSHNAGAVVRHVSSAEDFTDSRTHEAAIGAVHGLVGDIVGTTDTQTLTNKTLSGGTLTGTFAGTKTFSGATTFSAAANLNSGGALAGTFTGTPIFSGTPNYTGTIQSTQSTAASVSLATIVTADTFDRFRLLADGSMEWGSGAGARDVQLYREAANVLATNDTVRSYGATVGSDAFQARVTGDTVSRLNIDADGGMAWGPGGAGAQDTNLYRSAADTLKTDDSLVVGANLTVTGNLTTSGVGQILFARKTADTSRASTITATADPHLTVAVSANSTYEVEAYIIYNANITGDFGMQFGVPAGAAGSWSGVGWGRDATASVGTAGWTVRMNENSITQNRTYGGDTTDLTIHCKGVVVTAGTAGNFTMDWAQAVSDAGATIVKTNSYMTLRRVA